MNWAIKEFSNDINSILKGLIDVIHPVGSYYITENSANPSALFGGKWEQIKDRFILAAGDTYDKGSSGGEAAHKLTVSEMPGHSHTVSNKTLTGKVWNYAVQSKSVNVSCSGICSEGAGFTEGVGYAAGTFTGSDGFTINATHNHSISAEGGNYAHNNMPPYITAYIWKRIE